jgi:hypothetical protein
MPNFFLSQFHPNSHSKLVVVGGGNACVLQYFSSSELSGDVDSMYRYVGSISIARVVTFAFDCVTACFSPFSRGSVIVGCYSGRVCEEDSVPGLDWDAEERGIIAVADGHDSDKDAIMADLKAAGELDSERSSLYDDMNDEFVTPVNKQSKKLQLSASNVGLVRKSSQSVAKMGSHKLTQSIVISPLESKVSKEGPVVCAR